MPRICGRVGANLVAENIVGREADHEQIGCRPRAQFLVQNEFLGKFELVVVGEGSGADDLVKSGGGAVLTVSRRGRA
jgi:hypothetical protein